MTTHAATEHSHDAADAASETATTDAPLSRAEEAQEIVKRNVYWSVGAGLLPFPGVDFVAVTAVQLKMLKELSNHYHLRFFDDKAKKIIAALVTGAGSTAITGMLARSFLKVIPFVGQAVGLVGVSVLSGALTQAIGNIFVMHFESGGTLLNFDVEKMRSHFQKELVSAKESVKHVHAEKDKKPSKHAANP